MREGDMVRFALWSDLVENDWLDKDWSSFPKPRIGLLVEKPDLMSTVHILYRGEVVKTRAQLAEKAGRKDAENR
tara:strand:+ start:615 stop:836 length:222 start_codon:yes stop_codon:yes gene_type:complete